MDTDFLRLLDLPVFTLATGDWRLDNDGSAGIVCHRDGARPFRGGLAWRTLHAQAERAWDEALARGEPIYGRPPEPPGLTRLNDWSLPDTGNLTLSFGSTWFWAHRGSNGVAARTVPAGDWGLAEGERIAPASFRRSQLANPMTVNLIMVYHHRNHATVLIQQRGHRIRRAGERFAASCGGFMDRADHRRGGLPAPWCTAVREAREELGLVLPPDQIRFLSLCRARASFIPTLCGVMHITGAPPVDAIRASHDVHEVDGFEWWPFAPEPLLAHILAQGGWSCFVPLSAAALAYALADTYGSEAVVETWRRLTQS